MKGKLFAGALALMLCMGALIFPVTAYAASDTRPPAINAWLNGDTLHIEAADDDSGVEAIYIDSRRFNYLVDGVIEISAKDTNDGNEKISVYAIDFAGNKSAAVEIPNPHYRAPASSTPTPAPSGTTPAPNPTQPSSSQSSSSGATSRPSSSSQPSTSTPEPTSTPDSSSEPTSSAIPDSSDASGDNPFTPEGAATVTDNATEDDGKEFYTVTTADGNVFYIIIDRQRGTENVYLLNAVTEQDLMQLAAEGDGTTQSAVPTPDPAPVPTPEPNPDPEPVPDPEPQPEEKPAGNTGTIIFVVLALVVVGGAGYYFKIYKPKQQAADTVDDDFYDEDDEDEMEYEDDPDDFGDEYGSEPDYGYPDSEYDSSEEPGLIPDDEENSL